MTKLTKVLARQITQDWQQSLPSLSVYRELHLLQRAGPLVFGICLEKDSSNASYRPTFHLHSLCRHSRIVTLTLCQPLTTSRTNAPEVIQVSHHETTYRDAAIRMSQQFPLPLAGDVPFDNVEEAYTRYIKITGARQWKLYDDLIRLAVALDLIPRAIDLINRSVREMSLWPPILLDRLGTLEGIEASWNQLLLQTDAMRAICNEEIEGLNLANIPATRLTV